MSTIIIPGYRKTNKTIFRPKSNRIVEHKIHAYDEHGNVIVVDNGKDDIEESVNQYKDSVGLKNVLKMVLQTQNPDLLNQMAYDPENDAVDVTGIPGSINEMGDFLANNTGDAFKNLQELNEKLGTNFTPETLLQAVIDGSLNTLIQEHVNNAQTETPETPSEGGTN